MSLLPAQGQSQTLLPYLTFKILEEETMKQHSMALLLSLVMVVAALLQPHHHVSEAKTLRANESGV